MTQEILSDNVQTVGQLLAVLNEIKNPNVVYFEDISGTVTYSIGLTTRTLTDGSEVQDARFFTNDSNGQ